jgi:enoyl-CoA hydratase/carnithine racemase
MPVTIATADGITVLTLDRPDRRNALDIDMWVAMRDAARSVAESARAVIITGAAGHFCAGMDLSPQNPLIQKITPAVVEGRDGPARDVLAELKECVQALAELPCATFAAIEGACVGGGLEVALACDVRIAARDATIAMTETRIGMIPDIGGCVRLTRLVGPGRAADLIATARRIDGDEAFRLGVVERVVAPGTALAAAQEAARQVAANGPTAVRLALSVVRLAPDLGIAEALAVETGAGAMALTSGEPREGIAAFLEKRPPRWT